MTSYFSQFAARRRSSASPTARLAVAHAQFDVAQVGRTSRRLQALAEKTQQQRILLHAVDEERRAILVQMALYFFADAAGRVTRTNAVQDRLPTKPEESR